VTGGRGSASDATASEPVWRPRCPADQEGFARWSRSPNFRRTSDRRRVFVLAVREALAERRLARAGAPVTALDVGCGHGIGDEAPMNAHLLHGIRDMADELIGVEPDGAIHPTHGCFDRLLHHAIEDAPLPAESVDVAYAYYVVEHVRNPVAFLGAVARVLRPGGIFLAMTPNGRHWFSQVASLMGRFRLDGPLLRFIRGAQTADAYHYPVVHHLNDPHHLREAAAAAGFASVGLAYFDHGDIQPYVPRVFRGAYDRWSRTVEPGRHRELIGLMVRLQRD